MTLGRFSILLTVVLVAVPFIALIESGSLVYVFGILIAPVPSWLAYQSAYHDWTLAHALDHWRGEDPVEAALDDALRPPTPTPSLTDGDEDYFIPGCPPLR